MSSADNQAWVIVSEDNELESWLGIEQRQGIKEKVLLMGEVGQRVRKDLWGPSLPDSLSQDFCMATQAYMLQ